MNNTILKTALLLALTLAGSALFWGSGPTVTTITATETGLAVIPESDWHHACFAPANYILTSTTSDTDSFRCWQKVEVPEGWTYLTFHAQDGSCQRYGFQADFLTRHGADYRCFPRNKGEDIQITISNGILSLR